jgi:energy-coupling factor transporter transmembrane protein EcfT
MKGRGIAIWTEVSLLVLILILSVVLKDLFLLVPLALIFILSLFHLKEVRGFITRMKFWALIISPVAVCAFLFGPHDIGFQWIRFSKAGIIIGANMALRAFCMILAVALIASKVSLEGIIRFFENRGLRGLGLSIGVAYNMLFTLARTARVVFETLRLRGVIRRHPVRAARLFVVSVISNAVQHADDIVNAATVRAFDAGE